MKIEKTLSMLVASTLFLNSFAPIARADEVSDQSDSVVVLEFGMDENSDSDSEPLSPRDYYPLGMGVRKNSETSLVPFCVAVHRVERNCTYIQYFETESGVYRDSDRAVNESYGSPADHLSSQANQFYGKAVGAPFTGYQYSGGAFKNLVDLYGSSSLPREARSFGDHMDHQYENGNALAVGLLVGGGLILAVDALKIADGSSMMAGVIAIPIGVAGTFFSVTAGKWFIDRMRYRHAQKKIARKGKRILSAFVASKTIQENWTLIKGVKVPAKTYDAFVEFLKSTNR